MDGIYVLGVDRSRYDLDVGEMIARRRDEQGFGPHFINM